MDFAAKNEDGVYFWRGGGKFPFKSLSNTQIFIKVSFSF